MRKITATLLALAAIGIAAPAATDTDRDGDAPTQLAGRACDLATRLPVDGC